MWLNPSSEDNKGRSSSLQQWKILISCSSMRCQMLS